MHARTSPEVPAAGPSLMHGIKVGCRGRKGGMGTVYALYARLEEPVKCFQALRPGSGSDC